MKLAKLPNGKPEIFYTLQGEGASTGIPAIFIRLSQCNLQCTWCDTPYTWNWEGTSWETTTGEKFKKEDVIVDYSTDQLSKDKTIQYNVSLKLPHSGNSPSKALKPKSIKWFSKCSSSFFKFVVSTPEDVTFINDLQEKYQIPSKRIILMPEGVSSEALSAKLPNIAEICIEQGYRLSDRLHVRIWGNKRAK